MTAAEYLAEVKSMIIGSPQIIDLTVLREMLEGDELGLYRYRLSLQDESLLEMFERFEVQANQIVITKYSFHWQNSDGTLRQRWDNARHHPELPTYPHHVHDQAETAVKAHPAVTAKDILAFIMARLKT